MALKLYNTLTKREEEFKPLQPGIVKMYTCGPTVYGRPHIGNYSSFLMADLLRRWLEVIGLRVRQVKNITDVGHIAEDRDQGEDKIEAQARREKQEPLVVAAKYTEEYLADERALRILEPLARPKATETVPEMIQLISKLIDNGHAYETGDGVYFSIATFPRYGRLSGNTLQDLMAGARIDVNEKKKHPADFALWKKCVGPNACHVLRWKSPWGEGFPGWHIECSAMSTKFLGPQLDIHTGGEDNIFPHHECEIAQSEGATGLPFVHIWIHKRHFSIEGEKMSKSLGNVYNLPDILSRGFSPLDLRYYLLCVHYRSRMNFTWKGLEDAKFSRQKIVEWMGETKEKCENAEMRKCESGGGGTVVAFQERFTEAMNSDLNTSEAIAAVFEAMAWSRSPGRTEADVRALPPFISVIQKTFGCFESEEEVTIPRAVQELVSEREALRVKGDFQKADDLRLRVQDLGFVLEDLPGGGTQAVPAPRRKSHHK